MPPKVTIVANCQGAPLAGILKLFFGIQVVEVIAVHRQDVIKVDVLERAVEASDFVLTQEIHRGYPVEWVRTAALRERWPSKLMVWQNLYFRGYNPELIYLRPERGRHYRGPLGDYHIADIVEGFRGGRPAAVVAREIRDPDFNRARYGAEIEASVAELRDREKATITPVADYIEKNFQHRRLFYTFNHPSNALIFRAAAMIAGAIGLRRLQPFRADLINEALNEILLPINPAVRLDVSETVSDWNHFTGFDYSFRPERVVAVGRNRRFYTPEEVVEHFYRVYDFLKLDGVGDRPHIMPL